MGNQRGAAYTASYMKLTWTQVPALFSLAGWFLRWCDGARCPLISVIKLICECGKGIRRVGATKRTEKANVTQ